MRVISALGLVQGFGAKTVIDGVDLCVERGERVGVLGANGAGKTTLLRILATLTRPLEGDLEIFGCDARASRDALRGRIGYVGHQPGFYPELSAEENLAFFGVAYRAPRERIAGLLDAVGLSQARHDPTGCFSRGMLQRLAIARSLLHDPELWILDEPDSSLDEAGRALLESLGAGRTLVFTTHDRGFAEALGSRSLTLAGGRLTPEGRRLELAL